MGPWEENKSKAKACDGSFLSQQKKQAVKNSLMGMQMGAGAGLEGAQKEDDGDKAPGAPLPTEAAAGVFLAVAAAFRAKVFRSFFSRLLIFL